MKANEIISNLIKFIISRRKNINQIIGNNMVSKADDQKHTQIVILFFSIGYRLFLCVGWQRVNKPRASSSLRQRRCSTGSGARSIATIDLISRTNKQRQRAIEAVEVERAPLHPVTSATPITKLIHQAMAEFPFSILPYLPQIVPISLFCNCLPLHPYSTSNFLLIRISS